MSEWQPIETAPKDGTAVDLWCSNQMERYTDCIFHNGHWQRLDLDFDRMEWVKLESYEAPTHWMSPPEPPCELGEAKGGRHD